MTSKNKNNLVYWTFICIKTMLQKREITFVNPTKILKKRLIDNIHENVFNINQPLCLAPSWIVKLFLKLSTFTLNTNWDQVIEHKEFIQNFSRRKSARRLICSEKKMNMLIHNIFFLVSHSITFFFSGYHICIMYLLRLRYL